MIERWMLSAIVLGALVAVGGSPVVRLSRCLGFPRRGLWLVLMGLSVSLPIGMALRHDNAPPPIAASTPLSSTATLASTPRPRPRNIDGALLIAWGVASLGLAGIFATSHRRALAELASCPRREILGATVAVSQDFGPAAVGLIRSQVVLPEWVLALPHDEQQLVLRHELEHIRAGDHFVLLAGVAMTVAMPWNIGLWWQLRRLRIGMELDCDARVAPTPRERPRYAALLLRARSKRPTQRLALALAPTPSALAERLFALLDLRRPSRGRVTTWSLSAVACAVVVTRVPIPDLRPMLRHATQQMSVAIPISTLPGVSAALPASVPYSRKAWGRPATSHAPPPIAPPADTTTHPITRPRYDSLIPYVQGRPTITAFRTGSGTAAGAVRATVSTPPDSARQLHK